MTNPLGKGLDSLIPDRDDAPRESRSLDVLETQSNLAEPVYRFADVSYPARAIAVIPTNDSGRSIPPAVPRPVVTPVLNDHGEERVSGTGAPGEPRRGESVFYIEVAKIEPNPFQPRRVFDVEQLTALSDSIREHGILQPLTVTKVTKDTPAGMEVHYQLIAGERRWRAAKIAGLREVPVIIRKMGPMPDQEKLELALIENVQREDLNPLERAKAFQQLIDEFGLMQKEIGERIGKSREVVANALRLLKLPEDMQQALSDGAISESHARSILSLDGRPESQRKLFEEILSGQLTVRDTELAARATSGGFRGRRRGRGAIDPDIRMLQKRLEDTFGTRVSIMKKGERGKIIMEFYSGEELNGILDRLVGDENEA